MDEEEGHLELSDPPAHALSHTPAKAQVPEVDEVLVFTQPSSWVKLARIEEESGVLAHGIGGHLHQRLGTRWAEDWVYRPHSLEHNSASAPTPTQAVQLPGTRRCLLCDLEKGPSPP